MDMALPKSGVVCLFFFPLLKSKIAGIQHFLKQFSIKKAYNSISRWYVRLSVA
jgi:hypothetical protein